MFGRLLLLICCLLSSILLGVAGAAGPDGASPGPGLREAVRPELLPLERVENRLAVYGEKLAQWRELTERTAIPALAARRPEEWAGCLAAVENLAIGYGRLKEEVAGRSEPISGVAWLVLTEDIAFLEGRCGQVYQQVSGLVAGRGMAVAPGQQSDAAGQKPPLGEQEQLEKWNRAEGLFDSGRYDEAIGEFGGLLNTPQALLAKEKIREAQTLMATQLRRQAAGIMARKADDPSQKKKLLAEAWTLLDKIVTLYPESAIIDKVKQNQAQIEGQLDQLDPALLPRLKNGGPK